VRGGGIEASDVFFIVHAARRQHCARIGITVSRRVSPRAVTRNRIKRQIRESFRLHQVNFPGLDIVVVARTSAATAANHVLARSLGEHWERLLQQCKNF
jgi:ribonuclease P protein component